MITVIGMSPWLDSDINRTYSFRCAGQNHLCWLWRLKMSDNGMTMIRDLSSSLPF